MSAIASNVFEAVQAVERAAETPNPEIREVTEMKIGQSIRNGDFFLVKIKGTRLNKRKDSALATLDLGGDVENPTRHLIVGNDVQLLPALPLAGFKVLDVDGETLREVTELTTTTPILGPVIVAKSDFRVTHPEHAELRMPAGYYQIVRQVDIVTRQVLED